MKLRIEISLDNAAFSDEDVDLFDALTDVLEDVPVVVENTYEAVPRRKLMDANGNTVGFVEVVKS